VQRYLEVIVTKVGIEREFTPGTSFTFFYISTVDGVRTVVSARYKLRGMGPLLSANDATELSGEPSSTLEHIRIVYAKASVFKP